jgi:hypothetical protein
MDGLNWVVKDRGGNVQAAFRMPGDARRLVHAKPWLVLYAPNGEPAGPPSPPRMVCHQRCAADVMPAREADDPIVVTAELEQIAQWETDGGAVA